MEEIALTPDTNMTGLFAFFNNLGKKDLKVGGREKIGDRVTWRLHCCAEKLQGKKSHESCQTIMAGPDLHVHWATITKKNSQHMCEVFAALPDTKRLRHLAAHPQLFSCRMSADVFLQVIVRSKPVRQDIKKFGPIQGEKASRPVPQGWL